MKPNYTHKPSLIVWEMTRRCALACKHCRAAARPHPNPQELTTLESFNLIDQVAEARPDIFILSGGDPTLRRDLPVMINHASAAGLTVALSPSATQGAVNLDYAYLRDMGLSGASLSLDGASEATHDAFRGVEGTWRRTLMAYERMKAAGLRVQINTTISRENLGEVDGFMDLMEELQPSTWSVFMLVPEGRAKSAEQRDQLLTGQEMEDLFVRLADRQQQVNYRIKTTEGQHFRRVQWQRWRQFGGRVKPPTHGTNDGRGFVFVSHTGEICPSGFLPVSAGNVKSDNLLSVYQHAAIFKKLRDSSALHGKCARCEYRNLCGGSRARAHAVQGNYLAEEPSCIYQPRERTDNTVYNFEQEEKVQLANV